MEKESQLKYDLMLFRLTCFIENIEPIISKMPKLDKRNWSIVTATMEKESQLKYNLMLFR
jgi:hypothetical protein